MSKTWTTALTTPATFEVYGGSFYNMDEYSSDNLKVNDSHIWHSKEKAEFMKGSNIFNIFMNHRSAAENFQV